MGKNIIIAEKPSVGQEYAKALGVSGGGTNGYLEDDRWIVTWTVGHLVTLSYPEKYDESLPIFSQIITKDPNNLYALLYRGLIYDSKGKSQEAINDLQKVVKSGNKEFLSCLYTIAINYDNLGKYKEAYEYYKKYSTSEALDDEYKQYAKSRLEELKQYAGQQTTAKK